MNEDIFNKSKFDLIMTSKGFDQLIKEATYIEGSLIDHIYINRAMKKKNILTKVESCTYSILLQPLDFLINDLLNFALLIFIKLSSKLLLVTELVLQTEIGEH